MVVMGLEVGKNIDYAGIAGGTIGAVALGAGAGYLGMGAGVYIGALSSLYTAASIGESLGRISLGGIIGGTIGAASGMVLGALAGKRAADYISGKKSFIKEIENPDITRVHDKEDNFDRFEGLDLKFMRIGKFTEEPHDLKKTETIRTEDIKPLEESIEDAKKAIRPLYMEGFYEFDLSSVKAKPESQIEHEIKAEESFKGVAIGNLKIGKSHYKEKDRTNRTTQFTYKGEVRGKKRDDITLTYTVGVKESETEKDQFGIF